MKRSIVFTAILVCGVLVGVVYAQGWFSGGKGEAPTQVGRYQFVVLPREYKADVIYRLDTTTGEVCIKATANKKIIWIAMPEKTFRNGKTFKNAWSTTPEK
jgi:hypothetical protein